MTLKRLAAFATLFLSAFLVACGHTFFGGALPGTQQSPHYTFHYTPGDTVDSAHQEAFYDWDTAHLSLNLSTRIQYYKFIDAGQKRQLTGNAGHGEADPTTFSIFIIWPWDNHETTHILTAQLGTPCAMINEGIAVANQIDPLDDSYTPAWNGQPLHALAQQLLQQGTLPSLPSMAESDSFRALDSNTSYPAAGSFILYLSDKYGVPQVLQLFPGATYTDPAATTEARFKQVFGISLTQAEQDWHAFLLQYTR